MPKCTINGKEIEVKDGSSIIEAMHGNNQKIAHYCWHPGLSVAGVCRTCMVEIEGNPRLQIACNTAVTEGMKINNTSDKVKDAVKWGLDFHLINHPLDCPICDQAGECGLQDQYMEYGKYDSEMAERKVKKRKVVSLGDKVVLDSERCILCSRCVRFTDEVTQSRELGIFNRGDRSEIGTFHDRPLNNKYSLNVVDICPVGALTSKDFRFKQRVWYLKEAETICTGCSTGCNTKVYFNREGLFRIKPKFNPNVNGYWMCDEGRETYKYVNLEFRILKAKKVGSPLGEASEPREMSAGAAAKDVWATLGDKLKGASLVVTGQQTNEELEAVVSTFVNKFNSKKIYYWINNKESFDTFDGLLLRGDKNPNTVGLLKILEKYNIQTVFGDLEKELNAEQVQSLVVVAPENHAAYPDLQSKIALFSKAKNIVVLSACKNEAFETLMYNFSAQAGHAWVIPLKTYVEKAGTFTNHKGIDQKVSRIMTVVSEALTVKEVAQLISGEAISVEVNALATVSPSTAMSTMTPYLDHTQRVDKVMYESRKKNEFVFQRGKL
jgi:NADH-quinone oxidoreductase subunit G